MDHIDFDRPWCSKLLTSPTTKIKECLPSAPDPNGPGAADNVTNAMFAQTLYNPGSDAIRAQINFTRPFAGETPDPRRKDGSGIEKPITADEYCYLLSLGPGIDGLRGRAHGGFNALILDNITGTLASMLGNSTAPATARLEVDYVAPIVTPGVVLARAWAVERTGRKTWVKGVIEDKDGKVLARGKALYIDGVVKL